MENPSLQIGDNNWAVKDGSILGYNIIQDNYLPQPIDFTRASTATRVNADGLIEKVRTNLIRQSNTFNTTWTTSNVTVTSGQSGYDGSSDAWLLESTGASGSLRQSISSSSVLSYSFYAKAGNVNYVRLRLDAATETNAWFLLSGSGSVGTLTNGISSSIESVGGGWYRVSVNANATSLITIRVYPSSIDAGGNSSGNNVYIQDAQLETGDIATDYIPTTTTAVSVGMLANIPRIDYTSGFGKLLLEPQRTNLVTYSENFNAASWLIQNSSVTSNAAISPTGYMDADKLVENTSNSTHRVLTSAGLTISGSVSISLFAKKAERSWVFIGNNNIVGAFFNLENGTIGTTGVGITPSIIDYGNGWYRCIITATAVANERIAIYTATADNTYSYTGDGTSGVYIYGAQIELGSYATSYIPTTSTAVTRVKDSASKTGISSLINSTEGVLFVEVAALADDGTSRSISIFQNVSNFIKFQYSTTSNRVDFVAFSSGAVSCNITKVITNTTDNNKFALKWKLNDFAFWINGVEVGTDTSGNAPIGMDKISFTNEGGVSNPFYGNCQSLMVFPSALSDTELATLTTL